jgi:hypothetical protein
MITQKEMISTIENGIKNGQYPAFVYKFRKADDCNTESIVTNNELWFSNPYDFNDPYDCNVPLDTEEDKKVVREYLGSIKVTDIDLDTPDLIQEKIKKDIKKVLSRFGVCCFSKGFNDILQWSHYADNHRGICLKFDLLELCKGLGDFFIPLPVHYQMELPHYNHCKEEQRNNIADIIIKPKSCCWRYEQEIRIVKQGLVSKSDSDMIEQQKRKVVFSPNALVEIIFGAKATVENHYKHLCANNSDLKHVKFSNMELGKGKYYELIKK